MQRRQGEGVDIVSFTNPLASGSEAGNLSRVDTEGWVVNLSSLESNARISFCLLETSL